METNDEHIRKLTGNKNPEENYNVPDGYFDTFSSTVKNRIEARKQPQKAPALQWLLRPAFVMPAIVAVLVTVGYFVFYTTPTIDENLATAPQPAVDSTDITDEEIEQYLAYDVGLVGIEDEIDEDLLAYAFADDEKVAAQPAQTIQPAKPDTSINLTDDEIEQYLLDNADESIFENL